MIGVVFSSSFYCIVCIQQACHISEYTWTMYYVVRGKSWPYVGKRDRSCKAHLVMMGCDFHETVRILALVLCKHCPFYDSSIVTIVSRLALKLLFTCFRIYVYIYIFVSRLLMCRCQKNYIILPTPIAQSKLCCMFPCFCFFIVGPCSKSDS